MLSVTDVGLNAIANAEAGGFLINLTDFKISETDVSDLTTTDCIVSTDLIGVPVYQAKVTSIEVVDSASVKLTLTIPADIPKTGSWNLREIGVYLENGELFAYGALVPVYEKKSEFAIQIYVLVVAARLGDVINVVVSQNNSLPSTPFVRTLVPPQHSYQNTILVLDENSNDYLDEFTASIAVRSGPGGNQWGFIGYNRIYHGLISSFIDSDSFILNPEMGGFWLNDGETVICQVVGGTGAGFSRKMVYDKSNNTFTVADKSWPALSTTSNVAIWRSLKNQLPARTADLEDYLVLGVGVNTWKRISQTESKIKYVAYCDSGTFSSLGVFASSAILGAEEEATYVFIDGKCLPYGAYSIASNQIIAQSYANKAVDVYCFKKETVDVGGMLARFEAVSPTDGVSARYYIPIVPDDTAWVELFLNDTYIPKSEYVLEPTSVLFNNPPSVGTLKIVCFATYEDAVSYTQIKRYTYQVANGQPLQFQVDPNAYQKDRSIVYVDGNYYTNEDFTIDLGVVTLLKTPEFASGSALVDISVFTTVDTSITATVSGINTGPEWIDPAGRMGPPNKLVPKKMSATSDGAQTVFQVYNVPRKANIVTIAGGAWQDPRNHVYTSGNKGDVYATLSLLEPLPLGTKIDFICFTDVEDEGRSTVCEVHNFTTTNSLNYTIPVATDEDSMIVVIGGAYQHKGSYFLSNAGATINLQEVVSGQPAEIWYFKTVPHEGWRTEMYVDFNMSGAVNHYPMSNKVVREANTLVFLSAIYQFKNKYKVAEYDYIQEVQYDTPLPFGSYGLLLGNVYFVSGPPLTRLLKREDVEGRYMPRNGPYVDWSNLSYRLRDMLACPITKLLALLTGSMEADFNNGSISDQELAKKYGLQPVTKNLNMAVLPTAAYAGIGSGATLGATMTFNVYKYLEIFLKQELGDATFTIHKYEQGVKYFIDNVQLGAMSYEALTRSEIPMITYDTGIYIDYPNTRMGTTYPGVPLLTNFFDMKWSLDHVVLPSSFAISSYSVIKTQSVTQADDDSTQTRTFTHKIIDGFSGNNYTVKWSRPYSNSDHNTEYMVLTDGGGAPGYVQYFARLYAQWRYEDQDIVKCMYYNKHSSRDDEHWVNWIVSIRGGSKGGNYPAVASYTSGLTFGVTVSNYDSTTGDCDLLIEMTSGSIGYSYFPAEMLIKKIEIPVSYTIYPAISVNPDGSVTPMISNNDIFKSCCWTDFTPSTVLDCGTGVTPNKPTVNKMTTSSTKPVITGTYPYQFATSLTVTVGGQTFTKGSSAALTTNNETWSLDLSVTSVSLSVGFHDVVVSADVGESQPYVDATTNEIKIVSVADTTAPTKPTVTTATFATVKPSIKGTYPSSDAAGGLSVSINGWSYRLGSTTVLSVDSLDTRTTSNPALTASGNNWTLDMSKDTANVLNWGVYSVSAAVSDAAGNIAFDSTNQEVSLVAPEPILKAAFQSPVISGVTNVNSGSIDLGTPFAGRTIVVCLMVSRYSYTTWHITDATLGGKTLIGVGEVFGSDGRSRANIYYLHDDVMTSADLDVTTSTTLQAWGYHVFVLNGTNMLPVDINAINGVVQGNNTNNPESSPWEYQLTAPEGNQTIAFIWNLMNGTSQIVYDAPLVNSLTTAQPYAGIYNSTTVGYGVLPVGVNTVRATATEPTKDNIFKMGVVFA